MSDLSADEESLTQFSDDESGDEPNKSDDGGPQLVPRFV
jgi:hypothetical protein